MAETSLTLLELVQNDRPIEETARAAGDFFANMLRTPIPDGVNGFEHGMSLMLGPEIAARITRDQAIISFFTETLHDHSMPETILLTKERFQLADDYSMKIPLLVEFKPAVVTKTDEPNLD